MAVVRGGSSALAGRFTYRPATDTWTWSDGMFRIHGYAPGEVVPTTDLMVRHLHPNDVDSAYATRDESLEHGGPFLFRHRIHPADGPMRVVIAAGHLAEDAEGQLLTGHLIDVTGGEEAVRAHMDQVVQDFASHRAVIEQSKGVLMQLLSVDADTAWDLLRAYSRHLDRPVRAVAELLVAAATRDETPVKGGRRAALLRTIGELLDDPGCG